VEIYNMGEARFALVRNQADTTAFNFPDWQEFETSILKDAEVASIERSRFTRFLSSVAFRLLRTAGRRMGLEGPFQLPVDSMHRTRVAIIGGLSFQRCTDFILRGTKAAYLYDPTPPWSTTDEVVRFVEDTGISILFVSHPTFCERLQARLNRCDVHFIAEAVDPDYYLSEEEKTIDVLSFGRKYKRHHDTLLAGLPSSINYRFDMYEKREDLLQAMGSARIITNFPRSLLVKELDVEMLTMRYFQSFVSKALVIGHCPPILKELFGYDPMIAVDFAQPCEQVQSILKDFCRYQELIEKNYETVINGHTFLHRWKEMKKILATGTGDFSRGGI